ncbi:MAG: hypothetical protein ACHBN1_11005 [Heteroscytonema crispum UTEX LB 1556]
MKQARDRVLVVAVTAVTTVTAVTPAMGNKADSGCISQITSKPGSVTILGDCIPNRLWINPDYGFEYGRLMRIAIASAANRDDYDTAMINFYRAQQISGVKDSEVRRGLLGAIMAKALQRNPVRGYSPSRMWLMVTGEERNVN